MIYPDNFSPDIYTCEFTIERLFVFNPTIEPKMPKPAEQDYQDAKLLFYHPADIHIEIKRNDVGLMEAMVTLWNSFGGKGENPSNHQLIYTDQYSYIIHHIANDFWICFIVKNLTKEALFYSIDEKQYNYIASDTFKVEKPILSENLSKKFAQHFVQFFELFHGRVETFFRKEDDRLSPEFITYMERYILSYKKLNCLNFPRINATKFLDKYLNYAPIDKKVFMSVHFLMDVIKNIDSNIKHHIIFYNGYFIYSTLDNKLVQAFYDYFYTGGDTLCIDANKMFNKFVTLGQPTGENFIKYGARLAIKNNKGYIMGYTDSAQSKSKIMMESIEEPNENNKKNDDECFIPTVYFDRFDDKNAYKMVTLFDTGLNLFLFYENEAMVEVAKLSEIQMAVSQNIQRLSESLDKQIKRIYVQEDISKLIYENQCNFAFRMSRMFLKSIEIHPSKMISYMKDTFDSDSGCRGIISRCYGTWIYSRISNQRRVFLLLNSANNLSKTEEEKEKLLEYNFSNILY